MNSRVFLLFSIVIIGGRIPSVRKRWMLWFMLMTNGMAMFKLNAWLPKLRQEKKILCPRQVYLHRFFMKKICIVFIFCDLIHAGRILGFAEYIFHVFSHSLKNYFENHVMGLMVVVPSAFRNWWNVKWQGILMSNLLFVFTEYYSVSVQKRL